jgi:gamma-glutamyl:cysteine ligase YbdK (ATP-grasp superfamily)
VNEPLHLFEAVGIELEYMLVDRETLAVAPICDRVLQEAAGEPASEFETGAIAWSNELALHVIELKTNGPVAAIDAGLAAAFLTDLKRIDAIAKGMGARVMPTAMHPWMDPATETRLWPHDGRPIYAAYDRAFDCSGHGWGNLQSCHLNLPFCGADEFGRLHAAIRPVLPLLPALAASSPIMDGHITGTLDNRLAVYAANQRRIASIIGDVIPEPVFTPEDYEREILQRMYADIAPIDPEGLLQHEWLNSRGAIARFDRNAIEIRLLDVQETPVADLAIAGLVTAAVRALAEEHYVGQAELRALSTGELRRMLDATVVGADEAILDHEPLLRAFGISDHRVSAREVWTWLLEDLGAARLALGPPARAALGTILTRGPLARRILRATGRNPKPEQLREVFARVADCAVEGRMFVAT